MPRSFVLHCRSQEGQVWPMIVNWSKFKVRGLFPFVSYGKVMAFTVWLLERSGLALTRVDPWRCQISRLLVRNIFGMDMIINGLTCGEIARSWLQENSEASRHSEKGRRVENSNYCNSKVTCIIIVNMTLYPQLASGIVTASCHW